MHKAYLLMGGNMGNREEYLQQAAALIGQLAGKVLKSSAIYETSAWGNTSQPAFLNQAIAIQTGLSAAELMTTLLLIEEKMGRKRLDRYGPRVIDIDILLYEQEIHHTPHITIPHPELQNRRFALEPLFELEPNLVHPLFQQSVSELLNNCQDALPVYKLTT